jgi:hypothetical protein
MKVKKIFTKGPVLLTPGPLRVILPSHFVRTLSSAEPRDPLNRSIDGRPKTVTEGIGLTEERPRKTSVDFFLTIIFATSIIERVSMIRPRCIFR